MDPLSPFIPTNMSQSPNVSVVSAPDSDLGSFGNLGNLGDFGNGQQRKLSQHHHSHISTGRTISVSASSIHPNLFVRGIALHWSEEQLVDLFSQYGELSSLRLVKHSVRKTSLGYGFVRYRRSQDATAAMNALHGRMMDGQVLQVKLADSDAGPPSTSSVSGLTPCDTLYIKHVPLSFTKQHLKQLFGECGTVLDVKEFPCLDQFRGSSALVKMASVDSAAEAIKRIHGMKPPGWLHNIIVRFAESEKEKKERLARKEQQQRLESELSAEHPLDVLASPSGSRYLTSLDNSRGAYAVTSSLMPTYIGLQNPGRHSQVVPQTAAGSQQGAGTGPGPMSSSLNHGGVNQQQHHYMEQQGTSSQVIVQNVPPLADRLWLFDNFARFGGILSLSLDQHSRVARIQYSDLSSGLRAIVEMNHRGGLLVDLT